jgi:large subunit ribosomal protein L30
VIPVTLYAIVRVRGTVDTPPDVEATLRMLRLTRKFTAVIYPQDKSLEGMLKVVKDWVTWGEVSKEVLKELILRRGRLQGNKKIDDKTLKEVLGMSIDELVDSLFSGKLLWHKLEPKVKPVFRLHPPKGGFKGSIKKPFSSNGELGYRGAEINNLLIKMI